MKIHPRLRAVQDHPRNITVQRLTHESRLTKLI
jgi:hypothetical protein